MPSLTLIALHSSSLRYTDYAAVLLTSQRWLRCGPPHCTMLDALRSFSFCSAHRATFLLIALCSSSYVPPHCAMGIVLCFSSLHYARRTTLLLIPSRATLLLIPGFATVFLIPCYGTLFLIPRCTTLLLVPHHGTHLFIIFLCFSSFLVALRYLLCASPHSSLCQFLTTSGHSREKSFN